MAEVNNPVETQRDEGSVMYSYLRGMMTEQVEEKRKGRRKTYDQQISSLQPFHSPLSIYADILGNPPFVVYNQKVHWLLRNTNMFSILI